ncbi:MAG: succinate dehydrogenase [Chloroflexi bacterium]|nr:succinate dehydrogenase [Chloroflexota bacterium]
MTTTTKSVSQRDNKFETFMWRYMRWSGVLLVPLVFGHFAIMHVINSVADISYEWVITQRWSFVGWRIYDAFLLWFAGIHGFNGLRIAINDYVHGESLNRVLNILAVVLMVIVLFVGTAALVLAPTTPVTLPTG